MAKFSLIPAALVLIAIQQAHAANDWTKPCLSGVCSYDLPASSTGASGTLKIWGSQNAIADITTAAGWAVVECSPDETEQDVRIVCMDDDETKKDECAHLYASTDSTASGEDGAVGKIVRLPQNCGKGPFARIAKAWVPEDQSIPATVAKSLVRRDGAQPKVKALRLDTQFGRGDVSKTGNVNFAIVGANVPGAAAQGDLDTSDVGRRSRIYGARGFFGDAVDKVKDVTGSAVDKAKDIGGNVVSKVKDVGGDAVDAVKDVAGDAVDVAGDAVDKVKDVAVDAVDNVKDAAQDANNINLDDSKNLDPIDVDKTFNLVDQEVDCSPVTGKLKIDVETKMHAVVAVGVVASGTLVPPKVDEFGLTSTFTADLDGAVVMNAGVGGELDSGKIKLFELGIPGLDFPGILTIGPSFQVNGQAKASLDLDVEMRIGINYHIENGKFAFPKGGDEGGAFTPGDTPLKISAVPSATATGTVEAHLIPSINFGISALGGVVDAGVFLELDASATATLNVGASVNGLEKTIGRREGDVMIPRGAGMIGNHYFAKRTASKKAAPKKAASKKAPVKSTAKKVAKGAAVVASAVTSDAKAPKAAPAVAAEAKGVSTSFGGCFEIDAGLDVNVGADAEFFGLFDAGTKLPLFSKKFELFKKCFGDQAQVKRRSVTPRAFNLQCNKAEAVGAETVANETVKAANVAEI